MALPKITVVICTRGDRHDMLAEAVCSVYDQDYAGQLHVLVVYDSMERPERLPVEPARVNRTTSWVWNRDNHGLAQARNLGVSSVDTDWLAFLDDDDVWLPGKLTAQWGFVQAAPYVDLVCTGIEIWQPGHVTSRPAPGPWVTHSDLVRDRIVELHPSTFLVRRSTIIDVGGLDTSLPGAYAEDYDLLLRLAERGAIGSVRQPFVCVRWSGNSYFFSQWNTIAEALEHLLTKHAWAFDHCRAGRARVLGQIAFARAAAGHADANTLAWRTLRTRPTELRAVLAVMVANTPITADRVQRTAHRLGRGI